MKSELMPKIPFSMLIRSDFVVFEDGQGASYQWQIRHQVIPRPHSSSDLFRQALNGWTLQLEESLVVVFLRILTKRGTLKNQNVQKHFNIYITLLKTSVLNPS